MGGRYLDGNRQVHDWTVAQLARLFRTSAYHINKARKPRLTRPHLALAEMFARSSSAENARWLCAAGVDVIWDECIEPLIKE